MKIRNNFLFAMVVFGTIVLSQNSFAQISSNGTGGGDWNTGSTWVGGVVPTGSDNVIIQGSDVVTMVAAATCANLTMNAGTTLSINAAALVIPGTSWTLDATSTVIFNGPTTVQSGPTYGNLTYSSANGGPNGDLTVTGNLTITTATFRGISAASGTRIIAVGGNVVVGTGTGARISAVNSGSSSTANCTYNISGNVSLTGNNSGNRMIFFESAGPHSGTVTYNINGNLSVGTASVVEFRTSSGTIAYGTGVINLQGNVTSAGQFRIMAASSSGTLTLNLNGTSAQTFSHTGTALTSSILSLPFTINVNNAAGVTMNSPLTLNATTPGSTVLTLTSGKLTTTTTNLVTVGLLGSITGGSSSSFIDGPLSRTWSTSTATRTYPLGKNSFYRPLEIALTTPSSPVIRAELINSNAGGTASGFSSISIVRYYQTSLTSGTATSGGSSKITFGGDDGVADHTALVVAQSSTANGTYTSIGRSASDASSVTSGTSYNPASGNFLILGSSVDPLPVELNSFSATTKGNDIQLQWSTATEVNNSGFEIQKTEVRGQTSAKNWMKIGFIEGAGTSNAAHQYSYSDKSSGGSTIAYRLKQIDRDGKFTYSNTVEVSTTLTAEEYVLTQNYPNPFNPTTTFSFAMKNAEQTTVKVYNLVGQEVAVLFNEIAQPNQLYTMTFDGKNLATGIYLYSLRSASRNEVKKMLLVK